MPVLDNIKWERFAKEVAAGKSYTGAYKSIGGKAKDPAKAASALASHPEIRERIEELARRVTNKTMERVGERVALTKNWVLDKLVENVEKAMTAKSGSSIANRALELLGTELGMFRNDGPRKPITLEDLSDEDLMKMLRPEEPTPPEVPEEPLQPLH